MGLDPRITFSRTSLGTYFGADGLLKYAAHNYVLQSQTFNTSWTVANSATVTADATTAPDGTTTADRLNHVTAGTANGGGVFLNVTVPLIFIYSIYAKAGSKNWLAISLAQTSATASHCYFNLAAGTGGFVGSNWASSGIQDVGGGWYRCWAVAKPTSSAGTVAYYVAETNGTLSCTSPGDIYIWGAQAETVTTATTPSTYIPTTTAAVHGPRFDYHPITRQPLGLLVEEARSNTTIGTSDVSNFTSGTWTKTGCTATADQTTAPDGTLTADLITATASPATISYPGAASGTYAVSIFAKRGTSDWIYLIGQATDSPRAWFNINTGTVGTLESGMVASGIQALPNGWFRCWFTDVSGTGAENITIGLCDANNSTTVTVGRTVYLWGAQDESAAPAPSSYMYGISSRAADTATMTGSNFSSWYNQGAGTFVAEFDLLTPSTSIQLRTMFEADNATGNEQIFLACSSATPQGRAGVTDNGSVVFSALSLGAITVGPTYKIGIAFAASNYGACLNGGTVATGSAAGVPTPTQLRLGAEINVPNILNGHLRRLRFWNTRKTNAELQALTAMPTNPLAVIDRPDSFVARPPFTFWNPGDTLNITLSNGNLTATATTATTAARAISSQNAGKFYYEVTMTTWAGTNSGIGLVVASWALGSGVTTVGSTLVAKTSGQIYVNGTGTATLLGARASGDIIGIAVDLDARRIWFRVAPSGNWNGNAANNPATGVGGMDISALTGPLFPTFMGFFAADSCTANFGGSAFSGAVPSGFTAGWPYS